MSLETRIEILEKPYSMGNPLLIIDIDGCVTLKDAREAYEKRQKVDLSKHKGKILYIIDDDSN
jgi:hypothetical protein